MKKLILHSVLPTFFCLVLLFVLLMNRLPISHSLKPDIFSPEQQYALERIFNKTPSLLNSNVFIEKVYRTKTGWALTITDRGHLTDCAPYDGSCIVYYDTSFNLIPLANDEPK